VVCGGGAWLVAGTTGHDLCYEDGTAPNCNAGYHWNTSTGHCDRDSGQACCGNAICEASDGETPSTCGDCATYYGLVKCPNDGVTYYTTTVVTGSGQRVHATQFYYTHNPALDFTGTDPSTNIGPVTIESGKFGCP
jgi:hypothetical protein